MTKFPSNFILQNAENQVLPIVKVLLKKICLNGKKHQRILHTDSKVRRMISYMTALLILESEVVKWTQSSVPFVCTAMRIERIDRILYTWMPPKEFVSKCFG